MKRFLALTLLLILLAPSLRADDNDPAPAPQRPRPKVGLVLSGGGAKGMSHIGALKIIEELGIPIDYVVGTSIGSIIGGIYALGYNADDLDSLVRSQDWDLLMKDQVRRQDVSYAFKEDNDRFLLTIPFMNRRNLSDETQASANGTKGLLRNMPGALVEGQNLDQLFTKLSVGYQDDIDFNTLPIPFACVAVDLNTKEEVVFHRGDIVTAIRASMSIPGYFAPVRIDDRYLIDGGMLNNLPVDVVKQMGADYVITIDLHHFKKSRPDNDQTIPEMVATLLSIMNGEKYQSGRAASDILIEPNTSAYSVLDFDEVSVDALVDSGRVAALRVLPQLRSLADHLKEYPATARLRPPRAIDLNHDSVRISQLEIHGAEANEMGWLLSRSDIAPGKDISGEDMDRTMDFIYNTKCFNKASYDIAGNNSEGYRLKIHLEPQRIHEADLGFRFDSEEMASLLLGMSLNKRKLFGSKLDLEMELGINANATLRYSYTFRNLTRLNVSAQLHHSSMDVYEDLSIYATEPTGYKYGLDHTARHNFFRAETYYQITGWRNADIRIGGRYDNMDCRNLSSVSFFDDHYHAQTFNAFASLRFDTLDDSYFPRSGLKMRLEGGASQGWGHIFQSDGDPVPYDARNYEAMFDLKAAIPLGDRTTLIPQMWNRWLFGEPYSYYTNLIGGTRYGRYTQTQMPFIGINHTYLTNDKVDIARADLRFNLFRQQYLMLYANYLFEWNLTSGIFNSDQHYGFGVGYALNTIVGPVQLILHWSDISRSLGVHFSLGFDF